MKKNIFKGSLLLILSGLFVMSACNKESGEGPIVTKTIDLASFHGIIMPDAEDVIIVQGATQKVLAIGNQNIIDIIDKSVDNDGIWKMALSGNPSNYELRYEITVPNMDYIKVSGSGNIIASNFTNVNDVEVSIPGSGNIKLENYVSQGTLNVNVSGSGNIYASGNDISFENLIVGFSGSGNYFGFPLSVNAASIDISGSGNMEVTVQNDLNVNISGSGNVAFKGFPIIQSNITGSGNLINAN